MQEANRFSIINGNLGFPGGGIGVSEALQRVPHRRDGSSAEASWLLGNGCRYLQLTGGCAAAGRNYASCCFEQNLREPSDLL